MKQFFVNILKLILWLTLTLFACVSAPQPPQSTIQPTTESTAQPTAQPVVTKPTTEPESPPPTPLTTEVSVVHDDNVLQKMSDYLENGLEKLDYGAFSEGIKQLVAVLAEHDKLKSPSPEADELANAAEIQLKQVQAGLILEPERTWLDKEKKMITGSSLDISPEPSVILTYDTGLGRSTVGNVPILFQFVKGSGALTTFVNTSDYGLASCKIINFDSDMDENVIRASIVFKEKGFTYRFEGLDLDFVYRPPQKRATILVLEKSELGIASDPVVFNGVYKQLQNVAFDFSLYNSIINPAVFQQIYNGEKKSIKELALDENVSYLVVVFNDVFNIKEVMFGEVGTGLFYSEARATLRIIRVADAKILYQVSVTRQKSENTHGQGGSAAIAVKHVIDLVSRDLEARLALEMGDLNAALTGGNR